MSFSRSILQKALADVSREWTVANLSIEWSPSFMGFRVSFMSFRYMDSIGPTVFSNKNGVLANALASSVRVLCSFILFCWILRVFISLNTAPIVVCSGDY